MRQRMAAGGEGGAGNERGAGPVQTTAATLAKADPLRARRFFLGGLALGVLAMSATGLAAAALIESPRDIAAQSAAPAPAVLTAVAQWHVLTESVSVTGVVTAARTISVTASAPFGVITVTRMPVKAGDRVWPGHVIAEIDGRPILLLRGRLPAYRDLHEGESGPDVTQLQEALERLGYADFDPEGSFGPSTALALLLLYRHLGYQAPLFHPPSGRPGRPPIPDAYLPMSEVAYLPARSALVVAVTARVGSIVTSGPVLRLATGHPYVAAALSAHEAALVRTGTPARILPSGVPPGVAGVITRVSRLATASDHPAGSATVRYPIEVAGRRPLPQRLIGVPVQLRIAAPVTAGPVLLVPITAIFGPAGHRPAFVTKITAKHRYKIAIFTGPTADGLVAVQPVRPGTLRPGDRVLVGIGARA